MPFRTVMFDLDGTLVDSIELIILASQHAFTAVLGSSPSRAEIASGIGKPLMTQFAAYARTDDELQQLIHTYRSYQLEHHDALTRPYEGVNAAIEWLAADGRSLGVVTSKIEPLAHRALKHVGLDHCFPLVVGIESTSRHKPDPDPLFFAMTQLGAAPAESVYVGDSPFDLRAAHAAGIASIAVTWGAFDESVLAAERPRAIARDAAELRALLS